MYYIIEIQKYTDGTFGHLVHYAPDRPNAESKFYQVLAAASISNLPQHAACMVTDEGLSVMQKCYVRDVVELPQEPEEEEPTPEPEE